jgi:hypothetical protein
MTYAKHNLSGSLAGPLTPKNSEWEVAFQKFKDYFAKLTRKHWEDRLLRRDILGAFMYRPPVRGSRGVDIDGPPSLSWSQYCALHDIPCVENGGAGNTESASSGNSYSQTAEADYGNVATDAPDRNVTPQSSRPYINNGTTLPYNQDVPPQEHHRSVSPHSQHNSRYSSRQYGSTQEAYQSPYSSTIAPEYRYMLENGNI